MISANKEEAKARAHLEKLQEQLTAAQKNLGFKADAVSQAMISMEEVQGKYTKESETYDAAEKELNAAEKLLEDAQRWHKEAKKKFEFDEKLKLKEEKKRIEEEKRAAKEAALEAKPKPTATPDSEKEEKPKE
ncbi:MAG: hypothetical protein ACTSRB_14210 [Candidatus Helarchaeota archaeon]